MKSKINVVRGGVDVLRGVKPASVKWQKSVSNYADSCSISLPLRPYLKGGGNTIYSGSAVTLEQSAPQEGDFIEVYLGYNDNTPLRFKGFVSAVSVGVPMQIECEGYSYQLKNKIFSKSYKVTTIKEILTDLIEGTNIKLSAYIPDVVLKAVTFKNSPGLSVLDWFAKECLCAVCFYGDELFVGASKFAVPQPSRKLRIGWNTIDDKDLKRNTEDKKLIINLVEKSASGSVKRTKPEGSKYDNIKDVKVRANLPDVFLKEVASELQRAESYKHFTGKITIFLEPMLDKGYSCELSDRVFPERGGKYFVESVDGSFDENGGRQTINLIFYGKDGK